MKCSLLSSIAIENEIINVEKDAWSWMSYQLVLVHINDTVLYLYQTDMWYDEYIKCQYAELTPYQAY